MFHPEVQISAFASESPINSTREPLLKNTLNGIKPRQAQWHGRFLEWYNRSKTEQAANRRAVEAFARAISERFGSQTATMVFNKHLSHLYKRGSPLTGYRVREAVEQSILYQRSSNTNGYSQNITKTATLTGETELTFKTYPPRLKEDLHTIQGMIMEGNFHKQIALHQSLVIAFDIIESLRHLESSIHEKPSRTSSIDDAQNFLKSAGKLPFKELAIKRRFLQKDWAIQITHNNTSLTLQPPRKRVDEIASRHQQTTNQRTNLLFKAYILHHFGPFVARQLWHKCSELDVMLGIGHPLTKSYIKDILQQAHTLKLQHAFVNRRWASEPKPKLQQNFKNDAAQAKQTAFFNTAKANGFSQRVVWHKADASLLHGGSETAKRIENKRTILAFMDYLESEGIDLDVCAYIWKKHFKPTFENGTQTLKGSDIASISEEAKILSRLKKTGIVLTTEEADAQFSERLRYPLPESKALSSILPFTKSFLSRLWIETKPLLPTNKANVEDNREFLLNLVDYIKFRYSTEIAADIWKTNIQLPFTMGVRLSSSEIIAILGQAQKKSIDWFSTAEAEITKYKQTYLRNAQANQNELALTSKQMDNLQTNFTVLAFASIWRQGRHLSDQELDDIAHSCYIREHASVALQSNDKDRSSPYPLIVNSEWATRQVASRIDKINLETNTRKAEPVSQALKTLNHIGLSDLFPPNEQPDKDEAFNYLQKTSQAARFQGQTIYFAKMIWVLRELGVEDCTKFIHQTIETSKIEHLNGLLFTPETKILLCIGALLSAITEIYSLRKGLKVNRHRKNQFETLVARHHLAKHLADVCQIIVANYEAFSALVRTFPPKEQIARLHAHLERASNELITTTDTELNNNSLLPQITGIVLDTSTVAATGAMLAESIPWISPPPSLSMWGFGAFTLIDILSAGLHGYSTYVEYKAYKNSRIAKRRAQAALDFIFHESYEVDFNKDAIYQSHRAYQACKASQRRKRIPKVTSRNLMTENLQGDLAKAIFRAQNTGAHLISTVTSGAKTLTALLSIVTFTVMLFGKFGLLAGAGIGTAIIPGIGTAIGTIIGVLISGGIGLGIGITSFAVSKLHHYLSEKKRRAKISEWSDALIHHEGPKWKLMIDAGLTLEKAEELAFRKLIRRDAHLALKQIALHIHKEHNKKEQPITTVLKEHFRPYSHTEEIKNPNKYLKNKQWEAYIDRLSLLKNVSLISLQLGKALTPA